MMRFGVGFGVTDILITHLHSDHYLGVTGLLRTMSLQGREEAIALWGPSGATDTLAALLELGGERLAFPAHLRELPPGEAIHFEGYRIEAFPTDHTRESIGFSLIEDLRPGRFDVEVARRLGVPEGPAFGELHRGTPVTLSDGRIVEPGEVVGPPRPGRKVVYTGDTRPSPHTVEAARGADLLVHEATFDEAEAARARETGHSTAAGAAGVAAEAGVRRLVLTHLSARYSDRPKQLLGEARARFPMCEVAYDGLTLEVPFSDARPGEEEGG